ncbi:hypothetical protein Emtol_1605 [Emticicia oligotrophica DSM 17448]|uniref:Septum formation inhibitor Maf n=1 Tax=Emticicia oligotrophica (strain DSM 17448 / CIP 109782 / MTCC 6937 / GPTSA100-15) TaxID=929562 RepID=A0ABM5N053_EMTOG|nr:MULTISPECIES: hypothetical protein [Emticicia]AFK02751.1 hypothetical protein Emtol_1605 [Emticicia oligotrophica DSM 17448]
MKYLITAICLLFTLTSCQNKNEQKNLQLSDTQEFRKYWFNNQAEISSYDLQQARYGKKHVGEAVMVFVTEDFRLDKQVKLESDAREKATPVLKLNFLKKFITGIYDYSMYSSIFTPVQTNTYPATLKVTNTNQEWCGQTFTQLNYHQNGYQVLGKSYFEEEVSDDFHVDYALLEDELWSKIRLSQTEQLPIGNVMMIPSMTSLRLRHKRVLPEMSKIKLEAYKGDSTFKGTELMDYNIHYPESKRDLRIIFEKNFPHQIIGWEESYEENKKRLTTRGVLKATIRNDYWKKNMPADTIYRKLLKLKY